MVNAILPDLQHRHSQVRTACLVAVDALFDLVSCEEVSETLAPGVRTLCSDRTPSVRSAFHVACARWISFVPGVQVRADEKDGDGGVIDDVNGDEVLAMEVDPATLPEGCGLPHARSLLPFLLTGVADPVEANGVKALALVEAVGAANDAALGIDGNDGSTNAPGPSEASATLPPPFTGRPSAAARRLVRSLLPSLTRGALADVREWTSGQRNAGARLLGTILVFAESASSKHLGDLIKEIVAAVGDDDKDTAERVVIAARVLGAHVSPSHWLPIALDHVTAEKGSPASRASALVVLAAMLRVAPAGSLAGEPMAQLAAGLQSEHLRSVMDHPAVRTQLLAALTNAVVGGGTACEPASGHLSSAHSCSSEPRKGGPRRPLCLSRTAWRINPAAGYPRRSRPARRGVSTTSRLLAGLHPPASFTAATRVIYSVNWRWSRIRGWVTAPGNARSARSCSGRRRRCSSGRCVG